MTEVGRGCANTSHTRALETAAASTSPSLYSVGCRHGNILRTRATKTNLATTACYAEDKLRQAFLIHDPIRLIADQDHTIIRMKINSAKLHDRPVDLDDSGGGEARWSRRGVAILYGVLGRSVPQVMVQELVWALTDAFGLCGLCEPSGMHHVV